MRGDEAAVSPSPCLAKRGRSGTDHGAASRSLPGGESKRLALVKSWKGLVPSGENTSGSRRSARFIDPAKQVVGRDFERSNNGGLTWLRLWPRLLLMYVARSAQSHDALTGAPVTDGPLI